MAYVVDDESNSNSSSWKGKYLDYGEYRINFVAVWICSSCIVFLYNRRKTSL